MKRRRATGATDQTFHAARVSIFVALILAVLYAAVAVPIDAWYSRNAAHQVDARVSDRLHDIIKGGGLLLTPTGLLPSNDDVDDAPIFVWLVRPRAKPVPLTVGAPVLRTRTWLVSGAPSTATLGHQQFRLRSARLRNSWVVAGESLGQADHSAALIVAAEIVAGPLLVVTTFLAALAIGLTASRPLEQARRRQLDFTADASHELRTPLTVMQAEIDLALGAERSASGYHETLERIGTESRRLRQIVEDLLFLARFDSAPPAPKDEPVDLVTLAQACVQRFEVVARAARTELVLHLEQDTAIINAPAAWADSLLGVLLDNACRFAGRNGIVKISIIRRDSLIGLVIEDSGPGIPIDQRPYIFNRFHRSNAGGPGAGLGLAIADAVVQSTGGRWRVGTSSLGGARMEVLWRRHHARFETSRS